MRRDISERVSNVMRGVALAISSRRRHTRLVRNWSSDVCSCVLKQKTAYERSEELTSELQSLPNLVCRLLLEKKKAGISHSGDSTRTTLRYHMKTKNINGSN